MAGVILENISTKKLVVICFFLLSLSLACFIIGGTKVPAVVHTQTAIGNWCWKNAPGKKKAEWFPSRNSKETCYLLKEGATSKEINQSRIDASQIVFSFQYPLPREGKDIKMTKWFMYHVTVLSLDIGYDPDNNPEQGALLGLDVKVGYRDGNASDWQPLLSGTLERKLSCDPMPEEDQKKGYRWNCDFLDLFEIGNMHHEEYLVNIRMVPNSGTKHNMNIGALGGIDLVWFAQTGGFTLYFLVLKTVCFALVLPLTIWNWKRVADLNRSPVFLEKLLLVLASSAIILNFPVDWFVLVTEMKFMLLWSDIRQGVFLSVLLSYWLVFTGEHMVDDVKRGQWASYWKQLATVILASSLMFIFDICERGVRMADPFFSLWSTTQGANIGKAFIGIAIAAAILYFLILVAFVIKAIYNIWKKRAAFKSMAKGLRIHYMSIIYRFFFTLIFSAVCSMLTIIAFAMGQLYESQWKWDFDDEEYSADDEDEGGGSYLPSMGAFEINTAFQLGVYGTWNVYVMAMLIFYAPSHKRPSSNVAVIDDDVNEEQVELTAIASDVRVRPRTSAAASIEQEDETTDETVNLTTGQSLATEGISQIHTLANKPLVT